MSYTLQYVLRNTGSVGSKRSRMGEYVSTFSYPQIVELGKATIPLMECFCGSNCDTIYAEV